MCWCRFSRIFVPIGQSAFYYETHNALNPDGFFTTVVYDCGSTKGRRWMSAHIKSEIPDKEVDLLFLSHFHADHYNGIEFLNPKVIVIPLLDKWEKAIFWIGKKLGKTEFDTSFEADLKDRFSKAKIVYVNNNQEEKERYYNAEIPVDLDNIENYSIIESGYPLACNHKDPNWIYVPINPGLNKSIVSKFQALLKEEKINEEDILNLDVFTFRKYKKELSRIYKAIGNPNEYSLCVYSGPNNLGFKKISVHSGFYRMKNLNDSYDRCESCREFYNGYRCSIGCLYLGDLNLNTPLIGPKMTVLESVYRNIPKGCIGDLGTIQVPHHGSKENYNKYLLQFYDKEYGKWKEFENRIRYVISAGKRNPYHHSSAWVVSELMKHGNFVNVVSEDPTTFIIETCMYHN